MGREKYTMPTLIKKTGVVILILHMADFKVRKDIMEKERHYKLIKGSIFQEHIKIVHVYTSNSRALLCETKTDRTTKKNS